MEDAPPSQSANAQAEPQRIFCGLGAGETGGPQRPSMPERCSEPVILMTGSMAGAEAVTVYRSEEG